MNFILGVSGGIAVYKAVELVRKLIKRGDQVRVVMTASAARFVSPALFREISLQPVMTDVFDNADTAAHIKIAAWCDAMIVAPATANIIAKFACGIADDALSTVAVAVTKPLIVFPAMNSDMYRSAAVTANLATLKSRGVHIVEPDSGELACGVTGIGRLPEPEVIVYHVDRILGVSSTSTLDNGQSNSTVQASSQSSTYTQSGSLIYSSAQVNNQVTSSAQSDNQSISHTQPGSLFGKKVIVTAGGTREPIDPVRFITNRSSGKMGHAIATVAASRGAEVVLITTTSFNSAALSADLSSRITVHKVETARQMREAVLSDFDDAAIVVMAAAVADYRVAKPFEQKLKKTGETLTLELVKNPDILLELGTLKAQRHSDQILVGFAAETQTVEANARDKLQRKNLDMIVANDVTANGAGFEVDTNIVTIITRSGSSNFPLMSKLDVAHLILDAISKL